MTLIQFKLANGSLAFINPKEVCALFEDDKGWVINTTGTTSFHLSSTEGGWKWITQKLLGKS